jgi:hypothetical protein
MQESLLSVLVYISHSELAEMIVTFLKKNWNWFKNLKSGLFPSFIYENAFQYDTKKPWIREKPEHFHPWLAL